MRRYAWLSLVLILGLVACGPTNDEEEVGDGGSQWQQDGYTGGGDGPIDQPPPDDCSEAAKLVYVVADNGHLLSFDPKTTPPTLTDLGALNKCPTSAGEQPFSMGVDRDAIAWVLAAKTDALMGTQTGSGLYRVEINNGLNCTKANMAMNQQGEFNLFGMGFVANSVGSTLDSLYIAGGDGPGSGTGSRLGTVDMSSFVITGGSLLSGWPELTGNRNAELWGFYPDASAPKIAKIDKLSGAENSIYPLNSIAGEPRAWAFAFWGGDFWVFLQKALESLTTVYQVSGGANGPPAGQIVNQWQTTALLGGGTYSIVGAGVSTCAPVMID
jgi:hypothetical protein